MIATHIEMIGPILGLFCFDQKNVRFRKVFLTSFNCLNVSFTL